MIGELVSSRGLNQETSFHWACDTRWRLHFVSLLKLVLFYQKKIIVSSNTWFSDKSLLIIEDDGFVEQKGQAYTLLNQIFWIYACSLYLMKKSTWISNALSNLSYLNLVNENFTKSNQKVPRYHSKNKIIYYH